MPAGKSVLFRQMAELGFPGYVSFTSDRVSGTVTAEQGVEIEEVFIDDLRPWFVNVELYKTMTLPPVLPHPYDGPPRNRHERRATNASSPPQSGKRQSLD